MRPNFVLVTLDCVRPDHLGCYGYKGVETPNLDRMAASGVLFEQAVTHAPNTWVAHASLFTGCYPPVHGLRAAHHRLSSRVTTMAEWFASHGWATAAFPGTTLVGRAQGFQRGYELFDEEWTCEGFQTEQAFWRRDFKTALARAKNWMQEAGEPFLLWIHYMDTHHLPEFQIPDYYRSRFSSRWQCYDGKISYADHVCLGEIWGHLEQTGLAQRTMVAVFADHGEELHQDDRPLHDGGLGEDVVRVPLVICLPGSKGLRGLRVAEQVGLVDLFPTCCQLAGLSLPEGMQGVPLGSLLSGQSNEAAGRGLYLENWSKGFLGLRTREWKLILKYADPERLAQEPPELTALYHLPTDPQEKRDLAQRHPLLVNELKKECLSWTQKGSTQNVAPEENSAIKKALEGLGYM